MSPVKPESDQALVISPKMMEMTAIALPYLLNHLQTSYGTVLAERQIIEEKGMTENVKVVDTQLKLLSTATDMVNLLILSLQATCELTGHKYEAFMANALLEMKELSDTHQKLLKENNAVLAEAMKVSGNLLDPAMRERLEKFAKDATQQNTLMGMGPEGQGSGHA
jgi:hypothetical protein